MIKQKTKIIIASVLKPVDDVRNYEKIGMSISKDDSNEVHMLGINGEDVNPKVRVHPWRDFKRLSLGRLKIQWNYWKKLREIDPEIIICTTHELLIVSALFKLTHRTKIIYDVQEDYYKNLCFQHFYPPVLRHSLAVLVRLMEYTISPFITSYFLAESSYAKDIGFVKSKGVILDNSSLEISNKPSADYLKVVFTGTLSHYSKTIESIELFLRLKQVIPEAKMTVIGYCPKHSHYQILMENYSQNVELNISTKPVPHAEIIKEICTANLAIIGYQPDPVNRDKMPTKLFEYVAAKTPYLVQENTLWAREGQRLGGAIPVDFSSPDLSMIERRIEEISHKNFLIDHALWSKNEPVLRDHIQLIKDSI